MTGKDDDLKLHYYTGCSELEEARKTFSYQAKKGDTIKDGYGQAMANIVSAGKKRNGYISRWEREYTSIQMFKDRLINFG